MIRHLAEDRPPATSTGDEAVRRLFTPAVMEAVSQYPRYAIQSHEGRLAVWRGSGVLPAPKRIELWDAASELLALLTRPPERGTGTVVPGRAGMDARRQFVRLRNTLVGGAVGAFVGFILSTMAISLVFFRRDLRQGLGLGFFLEPLLFFGLTLGGAVLGAGVASRLPVRHLPSELMEDPVRRKSRERATGYGIVFGLFSGCFGGFVVFVTSKVRFRLETRLRSGRSAVLRQHLRWCLAWSGDLRGGDELVVSAASGFVVPPLSLRQY